MKHHLMAAKFMAALALGLGLGSTGKLSAQNLEIEYIGRMGLFSSPEFTRNDGYQFSEAESLTESGYLRGYSSRYDGANVHGYGAWVADVNTGSTMRIGFFSNPEFTRNNGYEESYADFLTESGYLAGYSNRYDGANAIGYAAWVAEASSGNTTRIGFFSNPEFTRNDGYEESYAEFLTESGYLAGYSRRYDGANDRGQAAWVAEASSGNTTRIGFFSSPEFTRNDGYELSFATFLAESGYLGGSSDRYDGASFNGYAAWVAEASTGTTTQIGLFGTPEFTRNDGFEFSFAQYMTHSGYVGGYSSRYDGANDNGTAAWVAEASTGTTTQVGLFGTPEFTRNDGYQASVAESLSESGYVTGRALRWNGTADYFGQAAWVAEAGTGNTTRIGFFGTSEFTRADGHEYSQGITLTESGYISGFSNRFDGNNAIGTGAWVAEASSGITTRIGLFSGPEFTRNDGFQDSSSLRLSESGYLAGYSRRYDGANDRGRAAWVAEADTGNTTRVGLFGGPEFTRDDGFQFSYLISLNESGYLVGGSRRYDGSNEHGEAAWVAEAETGNTTRVGILDAMHTRNDGYQYSRADGLNEAGYAWGLSRRYNGTASQVGETAWIWDINEEVQFTLELSVRASDGFAFSRINSITEDGIALGSYTLFDENDVDLGSRAFLWTMDTGAIALDDEISGGVAQYGWDYFSDVTLSNGKLVFVGVGRPESSPTGSQGVYAVPEPSTALLLVLGGAACLLTRRRRQELQIGDC